MSASHTILHRWGKCVEQIRIPCSLWPLDWNQPRRHREHKPWPDHNPSDPVLKTPEVVFFAFSICPSQVPHHNCYRKWLLKSGGVLVLHLYAWPFINLYHHLKICLVASRPNLFKWLVSGCQRFGSCGCWMVVLLDPDSWLPVCDPVLTRWLFLTDRHFPKDWQLLCWGSIPSFCGHSPLPIKHQTHRWLWPHLHPLHTKGHLVIFIIPHSSSTIAALFSLV